MKPFTKNELLGVIMIFTVTFLVTAVNMVAALRRARDAQRRNDIGAIADALEKFQSEYGYYPPSEDGKIKMCRGDNFDDVITELKSLDKFDRVLFFSGLRPCDWVADVFTDILDEDSEPYLKNIPGDPKYNEGYSYLYLSNTNRIQIYSSFEGGPEETGYNQGVFDRQLSCGISKCSYGKSHSIPLDKDIDEYERELQSKGGQ